MQLLSWRGVIAPPTATYVALEREGAKVNPIQANPIRREKRRREKRDDERTDPTHSYWL